MAGGWGLGSEFANLQTTGATTASSAGTYVTSSSAVNTYGAWTQIVSAAPYDCNGIIFGAENFTHSGMGTASGDFGCAYNIGIGGAGSERTILANLTWWQNLHHATTSFTIPIAIPAGSRIAVQSAAASGNNKTSVMLTLFDAAYTSQAAGSAIDNYGYVASGCKGTAITCGGNAKGSYAQITSATTADYAGFFFALDNQATTFGTAGGTRFMVDVGVGGAGSEQVILPNFLFMAGYGGGGANWYGPPFSPVFWTPIKAGSRIAVRGACTTATTGINQIGFNFFGVR